MTWRSDKTTAQRGYGSKWQRARAQYLANNPLCVICERQGAVTAATVVDHIKPHRGDSKLFWRRSNWQALCKTCHDSVKQRHEHKGAEPGGNADGQPVDPGDHWH
ncbi:HNH endonuclease [Kushneria phosphatilytica]|uniref:Putative HNH nuclease YajD n=1 Tax=Kushneria phosphatilytica TaxID=657387 RepID=A0A5C0ZZU3_9GAMM|nr:HNH endonuclease signature motif containing protein [Kushneria phosphatilytica]QEL11324.1 HNH endonuclease [Kushneria phosphatilytica]